MQANRKDIWNSLVGSIMEVTQKRKSLPLKFSCSSFYAAMDVSTETLKVESLGFP